MIKNISGLLNGIMQEEKKKLNKYSLKHPPTIGKMYEGLTSDILERAIPESLGLRWIHGIIHDGQGNMSGEIDCMLVKGEGERIPYTDSYKWNVADVIAVVEVKKNLYSNDLKDAFTHLKEVLDAFGSFVQNDKSNPVFNIEPARKAFAQTTKISPPSHADVKSLGYEKEHLYHTFVTEQLAPIRIVLGYNGFVNEHSLRNALIEIIKNKTDRKGVSSFPQLIICRENSLIKMNGFPYSAPMRSDFWDFYASSSTNPILLILELIWTRISHEINIEKLWGEDLELETFSYFLSGKVLKKEDVYGWVYNYHELSKEELEKRKKVEEWEPTIVSQNQYIIFMQLCNGETVSTSDTELKSFIEEEGDDFDTFIHSLLSTGLVALNKDKLDLTTSECQCVILPDGRFAVAENNTGRFDRWIRKKQILK